MEFRLGSKVHQMLKGVTRDLIGMVGRQKRAAELLGINSYQYIQQWTSMRGDEYDNRSIPLLAIVVLESDVVEAGSIPPITAALADLHGYDLVIREPDAKRNCPIRAAASVTKAAGSACDTVVTALEDGELDAHEREACVKRLREVAEAVNSTIAALTGIETSTKPVRRVK